MCLLAHTNKRKIKKKLVYKKNLFTYKDTTPLKKSHKKGYFIVYKIVTRKSRTQFINNNTVYGCYTYTLNKLAVSTRFKKNIENCEKGYAGEILIEHGIHVYIKPQKPQKHINPHQSLLECEVSLEDLVAVGVHGTEAVFMKVMPIRAWTKKEIAKIKS